MRLLQIRVRTNEDVDCLMRELSIYSPERSPRAVVVRLEQRSEADLLALLAALETCLSANDIPSARVELDGQAYMLAPQR